MFCLATVLRLLNHYKNGRPSLKSDPVANKGCTGLTELIQKCLPRTTNKLQISKNSILYLAVTKRNTILILPALQLNRLCVSTLINTCEKNLTINYFNYSFVMLLGELRYCKTECPNSSMYVLKLNIFLFNTYFYQRHNVDARHANLSMIGRDQHYHITNLNIFNFHSQTIYRSDGTNERAVRT